MIIVGLTGNYGMGKSTVAKIFNELGAIIIDSDEIVRDLLDNTLVIHEIKRVFGDEVIKREVNALGQQKEKIDKKNLSHIVFNNPFLRKALEDILHPIVFKRIEEETAKIKDPAAIVIIEAPVLFERGYQNRFDKIITVFTSEDIALKRLKEKGITEEDAISRMKNQFPVEMKIKRSDFIIDNSIDIEYTRRQVEEIYIKLVSEVRKSGYN